MSAPESGQSELPWVEEAVAYGLVAVSWLALWTASRQWLYLIPLALLLLAHPFLRTRVRFRAHILVYAGLVIPIVLLNQFVMQEGVAGNRFKTTFYVSFLGLLWALLRLYELPNRVRLPRLILFCAVACAPVAVGLPELVADSESWKTTSILGPLTPDSPMVFYAWITGAFGLLSVAALRLAMRERRADARVSLLGRHVGLGVALVLVAGSTYGSAYLARTHYQEVANIYTNLLSGEGSGGGGGGFSGQGDLSSVSRRRDDEGRTVGLRVFSVSAPGYLRGKAFSHYTKGRWKVTWSDAPVEVMEGRLQLAERRVPAPAEEPQLRVHPADSIKSEFFLPLQTSALGVADAVRLHVPGESLRAEGWSTSRGYDVFLNRGPVHAGSSRPEWLSLPQDPAILKAIDQTLAELGLSSGAALGVAVERIGRHFRDGYAYEIGVELPRWVDPMVPFLTGELRRGHCELYATAGTLLLRRLGIPARYVTGFVCQEKNPVGEDLWIARNRDAHAWIEFHHPEQGWSLAEFTPGEGVPSGTPTDSWWEARKEWLAGLWEELSGFLAGLPGKARALFEALLSRPLWLLALVLGAGAVWIGLLVLRRRGPESSALARRRELPPELAEQRRRYLDLERSLRRAGLGKGVGETLLEYAARIEGEALPPELDAASTVSFLRAFAGERYGRVAQVR